MSRFYGSRRALPAWRNRQLREQAAARADTAAVGILCALDLPLAIWSNRTGRAYCLDCRTVAPLPTIDLALEDTDCAACGRRLSAATKGHP